MRFKAFTVTPAEFESWVAHQADAGGVGSRAPARRHAALRTPAAAADAAAATQRPATSAGATAPPPVRRRRRRAAPVTQAGFIAFPREQDAGVHDSADADAGRPHVRRQPARKGDRGERREARITTGRVPRLPHDHAATR